MSKKLKFNIEAVDGNFQREYDTVEDFQNNELGQYVSVNQYSMTSSDGICVYYPADDYTRNQIEIYEMTEIAKGRERAIERHTEVIIAKGSGLGYVNLYIMQQKNKVDGNEDNYYIETDSGRFFIETREDNSLFEPVAESLSLSHLNVHAAKEEQIIKVFSNENLGFGVKKKEGINCFLLDKNTMLIQDTTKTHDSIDSIKKIKVSNDKGAVAVMRTVYWDGDEDNQGSTFHYHPSVISADKETYFKILDAHYPEDILGDEMECGEYDQHLSISVNSSGYIFDKDTPKDHSDVFGFRAKILKGNETVEGEVVLVNKEFLNSMYSLDEQGLTVHMSDYSEVYLELGKAYEVSGHSFRSDKTFTEIPNGKFKKMTELENESSIPF